MTSPHSGKAPPPFFFEAVRTLQNNGISTVFVRKLCAKRVQNSPPSSKLPSMRVEVKPGYSPDELPLLHPATSMSIQPCDCFKNARQPEPAADCPEGRQCRSLNFWKGRGCRILVPLPPVRDRDQHPSAYFRRDGHFDTDSGCGRNSPADGGSFLPSSSIPSHAL